MATMTITNNVAKGFSNKSSGTKMTWFGTSFNMPVPNIFDNNSIYTETEGMLNSINASTSYDLSGFQAGWEICACSSVFTVHGPYAGGTIPLRQVWKNPAGTNYFINGDYNWSCPSLATSSDWSSYQIASNTGCASWEVYGSGTYHIYGIADGGGFSQNTDTSLTMSNVPDTSTTYTPGYMWVEGVNFAFISANGYKHYTTGDDLGYVGTTYGSIWIEGNYIYWIGDNGHKFKGRSCFKQFASAFSNGATGSAYSGNPGYMWADNEFGWEHLAIIANDGYKYLFPSGSNPYA